MLLLAIAVLPALPTPPPPTCVMVSRGQGGCGGYPYMVDGLTGTADDAISYCLANPACIKVQWDSTGNIYPSDSDSSVQDREPNGHNGWSCRFKECSPPSASPLFQQTGGYTGPFAAVPDFNLGADDFVIEMDVTPQTPGMNQHGGTIIGRHQSGVALGWALILTNSLHVVLTLYGATGYDMRAPPWKPACVQDDVTFLGWWGGELMSARALTVGQKQRVVFLRRGQDLSLYVDGSESCKASLDSYTDPSGFVPVTIGAHYIGDQLTKAPFFGKIENTVVKRGSLAPPPALAP